MTDKKKYLITSALPYANSRLHFGHIAGAYLPADIFVRFLRMRGDEVIFICGTDEYGVPISLSAKEENVSPKEIVDKYHKSIESSFRGLNIDFDIFSGTSTCPFHKDLTQEFFLNLHKQGYIESHIQQQFFCVSDSCNMFLPDRYVEGKCPFCSKPAKGDQCDECGRWIDQNKLIEPVCTRCGSTPVLRETKHWFLQLQKLENDLNKWLEPKHHWKQNVYRFSMQLLKQGLKERAITRDLSWGVPVPLNEARDKVIYVWFDAPIGYISFTKELFHNRGNEEEWKSWWQTPDVNLIHFIGKDNIIFHALLFPAMLMKMGYTLPDNVPANEFLNLEGLKQSKSKKWAVWVEDYLELLPPDLVRFYLTSEMPETQDTDFRWDSFLSRVKDMLANNFGNLINRVLVFTKKNFDSFYPTGNVLTDFKTHPLLNKISSLRNDVETLILSYQFRDVLRAIMSYSSEVNRYFDSAKPWDVIKTDRDAVAHDLSACLEATAAISVLLYPVIPAMMEDLRKTLSIKWEFSPVLYDKLGVYSLFESNQKIGSSFILVSKDDTDIIQKKILEIKNI